MPREYIEDEQEWAAEEERRRAEEYRTSPEAFAEQERRQAAHDAEFNADPEGWYRRNGYQQDEYGQWIKSGTQSADTSEQNHIINNPHQMRRNAYDEQTRLYDGSPTADDLDVFYEGVGLDDEVGSLLGGGSEVSRQGMGEGDQRSLMDALNRLTQAGGYTESDRSMQNAMAAQNAQQVGAMNQAAQRGAYARGMGGGGAGLASALSGTQGLASANAMNSAQMQQAAMQRLMQGYGMQGSLAGQMNSQQLQRQQALDAYNQRQLDWRRQRGAANTAMRNQSRESSSAARQQAWENKRGALADRTQQFIGGTGAGAPARTDAGAAAARGISAGVSTLASFFGGGRGG